MVKIVPTEFYNVYVDKDCVAKNMPLQFALILTKAIYTEFYAEPSLIVMIEKVSNEPRVEMMESEYEDEQ